MPPYLVNEPGRRRRRRDAKGRYMSTSHKRRRRRARHNLPNPPHRRRRARRRAYRRNPPRPFRLEKLPQLLMDGAIDGLQVVVGKAAARTIPTLINVPTAGPIGLAIQALSAVAAGFAGSFLSPNAAKMFLAGGFAAPVESLIKGLNIPVLSAALGDEDLVELPMSAYPMLDAGVAAYPDTLGEEDEAALYQQ
jgi:hypothetical protein